MHSNCLAVVPHLGLSAIGALVLGVGMIAIVALYPSLVRADRVVGNGVPASCTSYELQQAVASGGLVTFNCGPGTVTITITSTVILSQPVVIDGGGSIVLDGASRVPIFDQPAGGIATVQNLTFRRGRGGDGGAILARGALTVENSRFEDNIVGTNGGAINGYPGAAVVIQNSSFLRNQATTGGALSGGTLRIEGSIFDSNSALQGGALVSGYAIIRNSLFRGNRAANNGGAVIAYGPMTIDGSTIISNSAGTAGGGVDGWYYNQNTFVIRNSTIAYNTAGERGGGVAAGETTNLNIDSSTIVSNTAPYASALSGLITIQYLTNTLVAFPISGTLCRPDFTNSGDRIIRTLQFGDTTCRGTITAEPNLGPLADYGGQTPTFSPLPGSPAIDAGGTGCPATDQRGASRPIGSACDIGAVEVGGTVPAPSPTPTPRPTPLPQTPRLFMPTIQR